MTNAGTLVKKVVKNEIESNLKNPFSSDLQFIYGSILIDDSSPNKSEPSLNVCVFANQQVDRCPTGSGVIARMALDFEKGHVQIGMPRVFIGKTGSQFTGTVIQKVEVPGIENAVKVQVEGNAFYCGKGTFVKEANDGQLGFYFVKQKISIDAFVLI